MTTLDPFAMPLDGVRLIEASAGTGKTWSITTLYLRLLLERELGVDRILVVTFTQAATEELRERIRGRIQSALAILAGDVETAEKEAELAAWLEARACADDARRLQVALASMDNAAVFTIHGFCQRVLTENAFDTRMAFDLEFLENEDELRLAAVEDFWRGFFADESLPPPVVERLLKEHDSPRKLLKRIGARLSDELRLLPDAPPTDQILRQYRARMDDLRAAHSRLKQAWEAGKEEVEVILRGSDALNRHTYNKSAVEKAIHAAEEICRAEDPPVVPLEKQDLLTAETVIAGREAPRHPFFDRAKAWLAVHSDLQVELDALVAAFRRDARFFLRQHLQQAKARNHQLYYDDLLIRLHQALAGEGGAELAERLRRQYPFALIDEFQDTDQTQYAIFRAIHGQGGEGVGLCLIGDPKQAIYGFRGGDIHAYLQAAKDAGKRYSLDTNWRSCSRLVEAVNLLFGEHPSPFLEPGITYEAVKASPKADDEPLRIEGQVPVPLQFWKLRAHEGNATKRKDGVLSPIRVDDAREEAAAGVAHHIAWLLQPGRATLGGDDLAASDIAILVRTHSDGELVQQVLRDRGIHSVALSRESVFATEEAEELQHLLQALLECEDEALLRHALAGRLLGRDATALKALLEDDGAWEEMHRRFFEYREAWRERGFIQAFQALFRREGIGRTLLVLPDGERRLTNLLHLVELLQQAARTRPGMEELVRWLADEIRLAGEHEEALLRLESDENLVKVVTMHASKGLEYPVVYLPFPWAEGSGQKGKGDKRLPWFYHDDLGRPCLYLGDGGKAMEKQAEARFEHESLAERLRLLYVSLTRAARLCVLTWGRVNNADRSALAWLLHPGDGDHSAMSSLDEAAIFSRLDQLARTAPHAVQVAELPQATDESTPQEVAGGSLRARPFEASILRNWRVGSYSGLVRGGNPEQPDFDAVRDDLAVVPSGNEPIQALPAGARFGLVVHELLESLDFQNAGREEIRETVQRLSWKHGVSALRTDEGQEAMTVMIRRMLETGLPGAGLALGELSRAQRVDEMEFHFSTATVGPRSLAAFLDGFPDWKGGADGLGFKAFQGLMHGYIDLVFRHQGRYWLVDYKSNRLEDYGPAGLEEAMAAHHYPLQALIYALALHRHLGQSLPDYDPARHLGGVFYLFTRGMRPGSGAGIWHRKLPPELLEALDAYFDGRAVA